MLKYVLKVSFLFKWPQISNCQVEALAVIHCRAGSEKLILKCYRSMFHKIAKFCQSISSPQKHVENFNMYEHWSLALFLFDMECEIFEQDDGGKVNHSVGVEFSY